MKLGRAPAIISIVFICEIEVKTSSNPFSGRLFLLNDTRRDTYNHSTGRHILEYYSIRTNNRIRTESDRAKNLGSRADEYSVFNYGNINEP
ncbi:MAG: hypothetical protein H6R13_2528 [Proteobacteria bacterium]|nr:hypothetical protein [Pseudomonadota bacterium]